MKKDTGKGVLIMKNPKYKEKSFAIFTVTQMKKLDNDPTKKTEAKFHRISFSKIFC